MDSIRSISINRYWVLGLVWASVLLALSLVSIPAPESDVVLWLDKVNHSVAYAMLAFLLILALDRTPANRRRLLTFVAVFTFSVFWGGLTELLQLLKSNRSAEGGDLLADIIGITVALALYWWAIPSGSSEKTRLKGTYSDS